MNNKLEIVGIDHGWSNIKTANTVFTTAVSHIANEPGVFDNILEYEGKYYSIGGKRLMVKDTKVTDDNFYLLTLAAIAKELKTRGIYNVDIFLSVGLPLTRFGAEKENFIKYLSRKKEVVFPDIVLAFGVSFIHIVVYGHIHIIILQTEIDHPMPGELIARFRINRMYVLLHRIFIHRIVQRETVVEMSRRIKVIQ